MHLINPFTRPQTLDRAFEDKMSRLLNDGKINSYYRYRSTLRAIQSYAGRDIRLSDVSSGWLADCTLQWESRGLSSTTIRIYMNALKCIWHELERKSLVRPSRNPFAGYKAPPPSRRRMALNRDDVGRIAGWKGNSTVEMYRDLWLFSYLCNGINFRDLLFLKYKNIRDGEVVFERSKTKGKMKEALLIHASLTPMMEDIIARIGNKRVSPETYIFRYAREGMNPMEISSMVRKVIYLCNRSLKTIADDLGIEHFTTYSARHSFATILNKRGVDITFISESLGHNSLETTKTYLAGFDKDERRKISSFLTDFCNKE